MADEKYIPYVDDGKVVVLFWRNGFAIKSNFNDNNDFKNLTQAKKFCDYQNEQLRQEESSIAKAIERAKEAEKEFDEPSVMTEDFAQDVRDGINARRGKSDEM